MSTLNSRLQLAILNRKKTNSLLEKGFTLVELLIVVIILGVLTSVALPAFVGQTNKAKDSAAKAYVAGVEKECQVELAETGSIPIPAAVQTTAGSGVKSESPGATAICTAITATPDYTGSSAFTSSVDTATGQANRSNNW